MSMMTWHALCHTCLWLHQSPDKDTAVAAGVEHRDDHDDTHFVSVEDLR